MVKRQAHTSYWLHVREKIETACWANWRTTHFVEVDRFIQTHFLRMNEQDLTSTITVWYSNVNLSIKSPCIACSLIFSVSKSSWSSLYDDEMMMMMMRSSSRVCATAQYAKQMLQSTGEEKIHSSVALVRISMPFQIYHSYYCFCEQSWYAKFDEWSNPPMAVMGVHCHVQCTIICVKTRFGTLTHSVHFIFVAFTGHTFWDDFNYVNAQRRFFTTIDAYGVSMATFRDKAPVQNGCE